MFRYRCMLRSTGCPHSRFAQRYDRDSRLGFLQVGFGSYAEYPLWDGPLKLGTTFPS